MSEVIVVVVAAVRKTRGSMVSICSVRFCFRRSPLRSFRRTNPNWAKVRYHEEMDLRTMRSLLEIASEKWLPHCSHSVTNPRIWYRVSS